MARKLRVYELGRHYGVDSKEIMRLLRSMRIEAKSHMSVVEDESVDRIHQVFQRRRELARANYAKAHDLDPEQLENVASLRPLKKPEPPPEPEKTEKKPRKKARKKTADKKKVVVIKKAGTETAVKKKAAARRAAAEKKRAEEEAARQAELERLESERAAKRAEHAKARMVKKLVKKAPRPGEGEPAAPAETPAAAAGQAEAPPAEAARAPAAEAPPAAAPGAPGAPPAEAAGPVETTAEAAPAAGAEAPAAEVSRDVKESVKESVKAAIRKRRDERAAQAEAVTPRRKRARQKRRKVDEAAVERQVKQTMAQMETGSGRRRGKRRGGAVEAVQEDEVLRVTEYITVQELAEKLEVAPREVIAKLFGLGVMATINQRLERDQIELLADEYERPVEFLSEYGEEILEAEDVRPEDLRQRPPVVTVMGHVDHGKTSLLDRIRRTNVIAGEAGGITQHIGAYKVETPGGPITFLDTPGHAAFTAMRARGAQVTDIVILVVAANDGVMPQTVEAINHAKAAGVPIIVAINKIDLPEANSTRVKQELSQHDVVIEEYGGQVLSAEISAKKGTGVDKLLELVHLQSEVLELTASPEGAARGVVIEASKEPGRGVVFTVLVEKGTLKVGDVFLVGLNDGRVRALANERNEPLEKVEPGQPAVVLGANDVPEAGDRFYVLEHERDAREIASKRRSLQRQQQLSAPRRRIDLSNLSEMIEAEDLKELPIIVKGDVSGSVEALCDQLLQLNTEEVAVKIVHKAVGAISESDVLLAANTGALIIGFHLRPGAAIKELAKREHVTIEVFDIIYEAVDTLKKAMAGMLAAVEREVSVGQAEVRQVFHIPRLGSIAGSYVTEGKIVRNARARLVRDEVVIFEGKISSLKRFKEDAREVQSGYECGIGLENFHELQEGDIIEVYEIEAVARTEL